MSGVTAAVRADFRHGVEGFVQLVEAVPAESLELPALGDWSVRDLIGHASRALSTVEDYCGKEGSGRELGGPVEYFLVAGAAAGGPDARRERDRLIAERGRASGAALGDDPAAAAARLAQRVLALVEARGDDTPMATSMGPMTLCGYLPTRTFELAVHGLDLATALELPVPDATAAAVAASLALAAQLAAARGDAAPVLLALCGRQPLPAAFNLV